MYFKLLFIFNIDCIESPAYMCGFSCESAAHYNYSLECSRYSALRLSLLPVGAQFYGFMNVAGVVCWFLQKLNYYCWGTGLMHA